MTSFGISRQFDLRDVIHYISGHRAHPGSEFVVANTLAKWEKLEPNDINFSQGFSKKVVSTCWA